MNSIVLGFKQRGTEMSNWESNEVIERLREYLSIPSVHPDIDYDDCVQFLTRQAKELDLPIVVYELVPRKPVVVITWEGVKPELPSILLNSHMDVVPVYEEHWSYPPFEAKISPDGFIYARGIQDMKGVGMAHLEAVRRLKSAGVRMKRTVHISFVPDEEIGSTDGMKAFSESEVFKKLNVGFELDESVPFHEKDTLLAFNGEKTSRQIKVTCRGAPGHGSLIAAGTAGEKLHYIIDKFMTLRAQELEKLQKSKEESRWAIIGSLISINLTQLEGGVQINVVPENLSVSFDIRIPPDVDHGKFEQMIQTWCEEAGDGVTFEYIVKNPEIMSTKIDGSVLFWNVIKNSLSEMGIKISCVVCPGATDARFIRRQGIPAINLSPFDDTPLLLHGHDERMHVDTYKRGILVMEKLVRDLANCV